MQGSYSGWPHVYNHPGEGLDTDMGNRESETLTEYGLESLKIVGHI